MGKFFPKIWYRGQSQEDYKLRPGIFRKKENFSLERKKMKYFLQNAKGYSKDCPKEIDYNIWLPFMQHYGLETRLLDWTDSPICALFFALQKHKMKSNPVVYMFNPIQWNKMLHNTSNIPILDITSNKKIDILCTEAFHEKIYPFEFYPIAVTTIRDNSRIINQKGNFTLHGNAFDMYELYPDLIQKIVIDKNKVENILDEMYKMGIDKTTFFPELTALAEVTNQRVK